MDREKTMSEKFMGYAKDFMPWLPRFSEAGTPMHNVLSVMYVVLVFFILGLFVYNLITTTFMKEKFEVLGQSQNHKFYTGARYDSERSDILTPRENFSYELPFVSVGAVDGSLKSAAELQGLRTNFFDGEITGTQRPPTVTTEAMLGSLAHGLA